MQTASSKLHQKIEIPENERVTIIELVDLIFQSLMTRIARKRQR